MRLRIGGARPRDVDADFLVLGTGFEVELEHMPELRDIYRHVALWRDVYEPPPDLAHPPFGRFPVLGEGFELTEAVPGACPVIPRIRLFTTASLASMGYVATELPGVVTGAERLATRLVATLSPEDLDHLRATLDAHRVPALAGTPYDVSGAME